MSYDRNYHDPAYKKWRLSIYRRDRFKCRWPGCKNPKHKLKAHHIMKWSTYPLMRFNIDNGITLCKYHHEQINGQEDYYIRFFMDLLRKKKK